MRFLEQPRARGWRRFRVAFNHESIERLSQDDGQGEDNFNARGLATKQLIFTGVCGRGLLRRFCGGPLNVIEDTSAKFAVVKLGIVLAA